MAGSHYDTLQVARTASAEVIRAAYKSLSQLWHPDRNPAIRVEAERMMKAINAAYGVLSDPQMRARYDAELDAHLEATARGTKPPPPDRPDCNSNVSIQPASAWKGLLLALIAVGSIIGAMSLWEWQLGKLATITGGTILAGWFAYYLSLKWRQDRVAGNSTQAAKELSWVMTLGAWAWVPFAMGFTLHNPVYSSENFPYFALLLSAWVPAYGIAKAEFGGRGGPLILSGSKVYGLLLVMCTIQALVLMLASRKGQIAWSSSGDLVGHGLVASNYMGMVLGGLIASVLYAAVLFVIGTFSSFVLMTAVGLFFNGRQSGHSIALIAAWGLVPLIMLGQLLWGAFHPEPSAATPAEIIDPFRP